MPSSICRTGKLLGVALLVACLGRVLPVCAQSGTIPLAPVQDQPMYSTVVEAPDGTRVIRISYPWRWHDSPSVELAVLDGPAESDGQVFPLRFVSQYFHGKIDNVFYDVLGRAGIIARQAQAEIPGFKLKILAERNLIDKLAGCIVCYNQAPRLPSSVEPRLRVVYVDLENWAADENTLYLVLPEEDFGQPCRLRIWFMRKDHPVWSEQLRWPGIR